MKTTYEMLFGNITLNMIALSVIYIIGALIALIVFVLFVRFLYKVPTELERIANALWVGKDQPDDKDM